MPVTANAKLQEAPATRPAYRMPVPLGGLTVRERVLAERVNRLVEEAEIADRLLGEFRISLDGTNTLYRRQVNLLGAFRRMARSLLDTSDVAVICKRVAEAITDEIGMDHCSVMLFNATEEELELVAGAAGSDHGICYQTPFRRFRVGEGVAGQVARDREPVLINDVSADPRWSAVPGSVPVGSILCMPLFGHERRLLGVLNMSHSEAGYFCAEHVQTFEMLCPIVGQLLSFAALQDTLKRTNNDLEIDLRSITDNLPDSLLRFDPSLRLIYLNHQAADHFGLGPAALGSDVGSLPLDDGQRENLRAAVLRAFADGQGVTLLIVCRAANGPRSFETRLVPEMGSDANVRSVLCIARDVTEKRLLEEQLRQSQKLEAIGTLAGGIAHDFNNSLTAIIGYACTILDQLRPGDPLIECAEPILKAGEHAASLTRQLLAFSRKQILTPRVLGLNEIVSGTERLLKRLLGETIRLTTRLDPELGLIKADPGQIEQVIVNLAVNARDAMPAGGRLLIEASNLVVEQDMVDAHATVRSGSYVVLAISDTGHGMDRTTQARIFEPFFTTKEVGRGTGLGLSTVYGIVNQSGGHITVYSEPNRGTTFRVYLPRTFESRETAREEPAAKQGPAPVTVLLAEDDPAVRAALTRMLEKDGHRVLAATCGEDAIRVATQCTGPIDLLLTDLVMPGMGGLELARELARRLPTLKILFMSGYTDNAALQRGLIESGGTLLQKPCTPDSLRRRLLEILPRRSEPA